MKVEIDDKALRAMYTDHEQSGGFSEAIANRFRFVVGFLVGMQDERDFQVMPGLRFEKLKGRRAHQHSLRLNDQWRLIIEIRGKGPEKRVGVIEIVDYH